jgi:hypothetical protein
MEVEDPGRAFELMATSQEPSADLAAGVAELSVRPERVSRALTMRWQTICPGAAERSKLATVN